MKVKELRSILNNLSDSFDDHDVVITADHNGSELISMVELNLMYIDQGWYEKSVYSIGDIEESFEEEDLELLKNCIVLS